MVLVVEQSYKYQLKRNVTTCREIYNAFIIEAIARQYNGDTITFNWLSDSLNSKYFFVGHLAPSFLI